MAPGEPGATMSGVQVNQDAGILGDIDCQVFVIVLGDFGTRLGRYGPSHRLRAEEPDIEVSIQDDDAGFGHGVLQGYIHDRMSWKSGQFHCLTIIE